MMEIAEFPIVIIFEEIDPFKLCCDNEVASFLFRKGPPFVGVCGTDNEQFRPDLEGTAGS